MIALVLDNAGALAMAAVPKRLGVVGAGNSLTIALSYLMVAAVFAIKYVTDGSNRGAVDMPESELSAGKAAEAQAPAKG